MTNDAESTRFGRHAFTAPELLSILDGVGDGITAQNSDGNLIYANPAAARLIGFASAQELVATPGSKIMAGFELLDETGSLLPVDQLPGRRAIAGRQEVERLLRFRIRQTGAERWSIVKASPVFDESGAVRFVINVWHDVTSQVTQQKQLEENATELEEIGAELEATIDQLQLRTTEAEAAQKRAEYTAERQRFLAEAGRLLSGSLDIEETLATITRLAVQRLADWATVTILDESGKPRQIAVAHADPKKLDFARELQKRYPPDDESTMRVLRTGRSELYTEIPEDLLERNARDAEHLRLIHELQLRSAMVVPLMNRSEGLGTITFIGAESGRTFHEDDLQFAEALAARAALALSNARLYKQAQEANRVKSDFLAVMSHELRTPLTAIFGYTELLATQVTGPINSAQSGQLERIRDSAAHLLSIIEDILNYARSEAGRDAVRSEEVRLSEVINEALALVRVAADRKQLSLAQQTRSDCLLETDRGKLRQILVNLLGNAVKFTDSGEVRVDSFCAEGSAHIEVTDTGPGIAETDLASIFEPFRQLESATTRTVGGTGLGLAVTKRFVELLGGSITVRSKVGEGTAFTLVIPLERKVPQ